MPRAGVLERLLACRQEDVVLGEAGLQVLQHEHQAASREHGGRHRDGRPAEAQRLRAHVGVETAALRGTAQDQEPNTATTTKVTLNSSAGKPKAVLRNSSMTLPQTRRSFRLPAQVHVHALPPNHPGAGILRLALP